MKGFQGCVLFAVAVYLFFTPVSTLADDVDVFTLKDAVDVLITAASSQSLDPGISGALSAVPAATRVMITAHSNQKMQTITLAIGKYPNRATELLKLRDRYQAIQSAITGKPDHWNQIVKEEKKSMNDLIARYHRKIDNIAGVCENDIRTSTKLIGEFQSDRIEIIDYLTGMNGKYRKQFDRLILNQDYTCTKDPLKNNFTFWEPIHPARMCYENTVYV